jgi:chromosome segregation ATPase
MTERSVKRFVMTGVMAAAALVVPAIWAGAQTAPPRATADPVLEALLAEVRALRVAMEQMASAGPRIQLFTARLQLQETRISNMIRRLDGIRDQLSGMREDLSTAEEMQKRVEGMLASTTLAENSEGRQQLMQELPERKRQAAALRARVSALTSEEGQLVADITAEQARWTDINARLDELERLLAKK